MNRTREQVYEYLRHLDYHSIKSLCQSDRYYQGLCGTEMFQKLIRDKYSETTEYKVRQQERKIRELQGDEILDYHFDDNLRTLHYLEIYKNRIKENIQDGINYNKKSWVFKLLDLESGFSQLSPQELLDYAQRLDREGRGYTWGPNVNYLQNKGPQYLLKSWAEDHNLNYNIYHTADRAIFLYLENPTYEQLHQLLTMIFRESEPKIYEDTAASAKYKYDRYL